MSEAGRANLERKNRQRCNSSNNVTVPFSFPAEAVDWRRIATGHVGGGTANRTSKAIDQLGKSFRILGPTLAVIGVGFSIYEIATAENPYRELAGEIGGWIGAISGAYAGAYLGAAYGGMVGGPYGAFAGAVVGGVIGAYLVGAAGEQAGEALYDSSFTF